MMDAERYLQNLRSEVKELHPLLRFLLPKLPAIKRIEYTHGPSEFGADFILHKEDSTLEKINYVGVVAKIGKITKGSSEVFQQIDECHMPRSVESGARKVHLNEVWVVTSSTISTHAKELIHNKFSATNVQFVDRDQLAYWIELYTPEIVSSATPAVINYFSDSNVRAQNSAPSSGLLADLAELPDIELEFDRLELDESGYVEGRSQTTEIPGTVTVFAVRSGDRARVRRAGDMPASTMNGRTPRRMTRTTA